MLAISDAISAFLRITLYGRRKHDYTLVGLYTNWYALRNLKRAVSSAVCPNGTKIYVLLNIGCYYKYYRMGVTPFLVRHPRS